MHVNTAIRETFRGGAYSLFPRATNLISLLARNEDFRHDFVTAFNIAQRNVRLANMAYGEIALKEGGSVYNSAFTALRVMFSQVNLYRKMEHCPLRQAWQGVINVELNRHNDDPGFDL